MTSRIKLSDILIVFSRGFGVSVSDLKGPSRCQPLTLYRQMAMYAARALTGRSLREIGIAFGDRDHTTILSGMGKVRRAAKHDPVFAAVMGEMIQRIQARAQTADRHVCIRMATAGDFGGMQPMYAPPPPARRAIAHFPTLPVRAQIRAHEARLRCTGHLTL